MRKRLIEKITKSKKGSLGYTLQELLVVIGIIAITCAIAIPSIFIIRDSLRFAQANDYAKSIFLAAQQNLTEIRSDGGLGPIQSVNDSSTAVARGHCGFPDSEWSDEYVFTASRSTTHAAAYNLVLPVNSVEATVRDQQVIIEYNPVTGSVYAVFYCEDQDVDLLGEYNNNRLPREKAARKAMMVGYYDGSGLSSENLEVEQSQAQVEFTNGEEAMVTVRIPMPSQYYNKQNVFEEGLQVTLTIHGESSWGGSMEILIKDTGATDNCSLDINGNTMLVTYPLDSLADYRSFANLSTVYSENGAAADVSVTTLSDDSFVAGQNILPGDNVTIQADVTFVHTDDNPAVEIGPGILAGVNPMFDYLLPSPTDAGKYILAVANGRNLQNLNAIHPAIADSVKAVVFTEDINWSSTVAHYNSVYGISGNTYFNSADEAPARSLPYFVPIQNEHLFGTAEFIYLDGGSNSSQENIIINIINWLLGQSGSSMLRNDRVPTLTDELDTQTVNGVQIGDTHATIDGQGHKVAFLNIDATRYTSCDASFYALGDNQSVNYYFAGLFGYANTTINDLHVVNPIIKGHNFVEGEYMDPATGALLGAGGYNTLVTNCSTYLDSSMEGFNWAYGLSSAQSGYDAASSMNWYGVSGEGAVGGLVGYAKSHRTVVGELGSDTRYLAFSHSFAAVPVSGSMRGNRWLDSQGNPQKDYGYSNGVGGFIGNSQLTNFYNCYASGNVMAKYTYHASAGWRDNAATYLGLGGNGRLAMGAGGFVGTSHGTRYTNCFSAGNVINENRNDTTGGFVGMMCYDATKAYGHHSSSLTSAQVAQHTVFDSCYAVGMCTNGGGLYLENFSGSNGKIVASYGNLKTYYTGDYYKLLAPYAIVNNHGQTSYPNLPPYDDLYIFKDSYYLSQYNGTTGVSQDSSNKCAVPITYDELVNLQTKYDDESADGWIRQQVEAIKTEPLDADDIQPVVQEVLAEIFNLDLGDILSGIFGNETEDVKRVKHILETLANESNYNVYFVIDSYRQNGLADLYASRYSEGFPSPPWEDASEANTHYYGTASAGKVYPFPKLEGMDYYGLWPEKTLDAGLAYFEVYETEDGHVTGYYFDREDTSQLRNFKEAKVISDGYVIFTANSDDMIDVYVNDTLVASGLMPGSASTVTMESLTTPDANSYYVVTLPKNVLDAAAGAGGSYYYKMELNIRNSGSAEYVVAYFNPNTGLSQVNSSSRPTMLPASISIRSARQLAALASEPLLWGEDYHYVQHMNIDAPAYTGANYTTADASAILAEIAAGGSIGTEAAPFLGSYTGRGYAEQAQIIDFVPGFTAAADNAAGTAGLFGVIGESGLVDCLQVLHQNPVTAGSTDTGTVGSAGLLAGISSGTIQQIDLVLEDSAALTADQAAGLLVGSLKGTLTNSTVTTGNAVDLSAEHAGLVIGTAENAVIENIIVTQNDADDENAATVGFTAAAEFAGGFAGSMTATEVANVTVQLGTMSADAAAAGGFAGSFTGGTAEAVSVSVESALTNTRSAVEDETVFAACLTGISDSVEYAQISVTVNGGITGSSTAGVFGSLTEGKVQNANARLNGTISGSADAAGFAVLVGEGTGVIENSHVYLNTADSKVLAQQRAAGFAVELGGTTLGTGVQLGTYGKNNVKEAAAAIQGGTCATGYACTVTGSVNNGSVMGAADITAASGTAAGFAAELTGNGRIAGSAVTPAKGDQTSHYRFNSNANLNISGTAAAGFAGTVDSAAAIENCYVLGTIAGTDTGAGFVLTNEGAINGSTANIAIAGGHAFAGSNIGTISNCYGWYGDGLADGNTTAVTTEADTGAYTGSYFVDIDILEGEDSAVSSVVLFDAAGAVHEMLPSVLSTSVGLLNGTGSYDWFGPATYAAKPYSSITPATYSYPMLRTHYGDWVTTPQYAYGVMYYEVSDDGVWSVNIVDMTDPDITIEDDLLNLDTLNFGDTTTGIKEAGYAVFCRTSDDPNSLFAANRGWTISDEAIPLKDADGNDTAFKTQVFDSFVAMVKGQKAERYSFYKLTTDGILTFDGSDGDVSVVTWYANAIDVAGTQADPYLIRTPGQFANVGRSAASAFLQKHTLAAESFTTIAAFSGSYDGNHLPMTITGGNTWITTLNGTVSNVNLTVSENVTAPVIADVADSGTVTVTDTINVLGGIDAEGALIGTAGGTVSTGAVSVSGTVSGSLMDSVDGTVTTGAITTGNVTGTLFGTLDGAALQTGSVFVQDVSGSACWLANNVTDSAVTLDAITVNTAQDVPAMIGTVTGTSVVTGSRVDLSGAALAQHLVTTVSGGATLQSFAVEAGSLKTSLIGTVSGIAATEDAEAVITTLNAISVTAGDSESFSGSGLLVGSLGSSTAVTGCGVTTGTVSVTAIPVHAENETDTKPFGGIAPVVPADAVLTGNTVDTTLNVTGENALQTIVGGITAINGGEISGGTADVTVNYTQTDDDMVSIGSLVGWMRPGSAVSGTEDAPITATGAITLTGEGSGADRENYFIGGAVGSNLGGSCSHVTTQVNVSSAWAGTALVESGCDPLRVNPSGQGTVGKFVGYVESGSFTDCAATNSEGAYQFLGQIQAVAATIPGTDLYISDTARDNVNLDWDHDPTEEELVAAGFTKVTTDTYTYHTYAAVLTDCTFVWTDNATYNQTFDATYLYGSTKTPRNLYTAVNVGAASYQALTRDIHYSSFADGRSDDGIDTGYYAWNDAAGEYQKVILDYTRNGSRGDYSYIYKFRFETETSVYFYQSGTLDDNDTAYGGPTLYTYGGPTSFPTTEEQTMYMIVVNDSTRGLRALNVDGSAVAFTENFDLVTNEDLAGAIWLSTGSDAHWQNMSQPGRYLRLFNSEIVSATARNIRVSADGSDSSGNTVFIMRNSDRSDQNGQRYLAYRSGSFALERRDDNAVSVSIYRVEHNGLTWGTAFDMMDEIDNSCVATDADGNVVQLPAPAAAVEEESTIVSALSALLFNPSRKGQI